MHLIPFTVEIPDDKVDKNLKYKLKRELTGILNWAVEGVIKWQREGLEMPKAVMDAVKEYKSEMDVISAFLEDCTIQGPGETKASELYKAYADWAEENGEYKMSNTMFGKEVAIRYERVKRRDGWFYQGIRLNNDSKPYQINWNN
ncbi:MAG TPA: DNA primase, partial [Thermoanaerobacterales bacterium]|nr:DNA primase [Thermoanaerobacterales bacterium]